MALTLASGRLAQGAPASPDADGGGVPLAALAPAELAIPPASSLMTSGVLSSTLSNQELYLEVSVNGVSTRMVARFRSIDGRLYSPESELRQLGFVIDPALTGKDGWVELARIPTLNYRLDSLHQLLDITVSPAQLVPHRYDGSEGRRLHPTASYGAALNYDAYAQHSFVDGGADSSSVSALLDFRAFAPWGTFQQSGILRQLHPNPGDADSALRLDTAFVSSDADTLRTWRAGDLITDGNLAWTSPVRMGGLQLQRDFRLQPNLITFPVPLLSGSAAVPSTVDVFVNNVQQLSRPVQPGPFVIDNLPVLTGQGEMRVVVRDELGRSQVSTLPFYAAPSLLKQGLFDYSAEAGFLRRNYGQSSNAYDRHPSGSGSLRYGLYSNLTVEGHGEATAGLFSGGLGLVLGAGRWGVASLSGAGSHAGDRSGAQLGFSYQFSSPELSVYASTQHHFGGYQTLATLGQATASPSIDQVSVSSPLGRGSVSLGYVRVAGSSILSTATLTAGGGTCTPGTAGCGTTNPPTQLATLAYTVSPLDRLSLSLTLFRQFSPDQTYGAFLGLSYFFGQRVSASADVQYHHLQGATETMRAVQSTPVEGTGMGWAVQASAGEFPSQQASVEYRFPVVTAETGVYHNSGAATPYLDVRGAVVGMGGGLMLSNPIYDSFAVVDLGVPQVGVLHENRPIGSTDSAGRLLIPNLAAYVENHLSIEPRDVPPDVELQQTADVATPTDRAGVLVKFALRREDAATVRLRLPDGSPVPLGSSVQLNGGAEFFVVGYDGVSYLKHLQPDNYVVVMLADATCTATFRYQARPGHAVSIGPVTCQTSTESAP